MALVATVFEQWQLLGLVSFVAIVLFKFFLYPIFLAPVSKIPSAHPLATFSTLWIQWHRWKGTDFDAVAAAFARKGPYIRLGPNEIATNSKDGFECVYGVGKKNLDKHKTYDYFMNHGVRNMFTSLDSKQHSHRRARISSIYSKVFVQNSPHFRSILQSILVQRIVPVLDRATHTRTGSLDVLPLFHAYPLDFMSAFVFGLPESHNLIEDLNTRQLWLDTFLIIFQSSAVTLLREFKWFTRFVTVLGVQLLPDGYAEARQRSEAWASNKVNRLEGSFIKLYSLSEEFADGDFPILFSAVREGILQDAGIGTAIGMNAEQCRQTASECNDHIGSAGDTVGIAFSYIFYQLSKHPEIQDELRRELLSIPSPFLLSQDHDNSATQLPPAEDLQRLPFLNAVIREGLRLRNSPPGMDPRVTPPGRLSTIGPYKDIPPGVRVGAYTHLLHRTWDLYDDPTTWNPYRWLHDGADSAKGKNRALFAFSGGSRGCIGQHISNELMRNALAVVYTNFRTTIADESKYPGDNGFLDGSGTEQLWIKFERLD